MEIVGSIKVQRSTPPSEHVCPFILWWRQQKFLLLPYVSSVYWRNCPNYLKCDQICPALIHMAACAAVWRVKGQLHYLGGAQPTGGKEACLLHNNIHRFLLGQQANWPVPVVQSSHCCAGLSVDILYLAWQTRGKRRDGQGSTVPGSLAVGYERFPNLSWLAPINTQPIHHHCRAAYWSWWAYRKWMDIVFCAEEAGVNNKWCQPASALGFFVLLSLDDEIWTCGPVV